MRRGANDKALRLADEHVVAEHGQLPPDSTRPDTDDSEAQAVGRRRARDKSRENPR